MTPFYRPPDFGFAFYSNFGACAVSEISYSVSRDMHSCKLAIVVQSNRRLWKHRAVYQRTARMWSVCGVVARVLNRALDLQVPT